MDITINAAQIAELYSVGQELYIGSYDNNGYRNNGWYKDHHKGEIIFYLLPRFGRPKYYECDLYRNTWGASSKTYTLDEMNAYIEKDECEKIKQGILFKYNNEYYWKPYVNIIMVNDKQYRIHKNTIEECKQYIKEIRESKNSLIEITI